MWYTEAHTMITSWKCYILCVLIRVIFHIFLEKYLLEIVKNNVRKIMHNLSTLTKLIIQGGCPILFREKLLLLQTRFMLRIALHDDQRLYLRLFSKEFISRGIKDTLLCSLNNDVWSRIWIVVVWRAKNCVI